MEMESVSDRYLNENEAALLTGLSVQTLRNWRCKGIGFPYTKIGRSVRYLRSEIISMMESKKITFPRFEIQKGLGKQMNEKETQALVWCPESERYCRAR